MEMSVVPDILDQARPPCRVDICMQPAEVAAALRHLPGLVFFDSSGNLPPHTHAPISIIAARPVETLTGVIHNRQDLNYLRDKLADYQTHYPSFGFPMGAACGWIDYEGEDDYVDLGVIEGHCSYAWWEVLGKLEEIEQHQQKKAA